LKRDIQHASGNGSQSTKRNRDRKMMLREMGRARALAGLMVCLAFAPRGGAQQDASMPDLKPNPLAALRDFEGSSEEDYQLGRGDEISIDFGGRPELNGKRIVGPDGRITIAPAGSILVADKTREQAAQAIAAAMTSYYSWLSVTVGVDKYTSNRVLLLGAVDHPGVLTFDQRPTLLEVLTRGGGLGGPSGNNGGSTTALARTAPTTPERCAIYRGTDKVVWVDLKGLLDNGSPLADLRLRRDDVVYVPSPMERYVSVMGQVAHPGAFQLENTSTLARLLAEAGGITLQAGHNPEIEVVQPSTGTTRVVSFKTLLQPGPLDLKLQSGDIIYIPESGFNRFTYGLERLSPLVTMFTAAALFGQ
jgi:polysaccharide export outer membrane protein